MLSSRYRTSERDVRREHPKFIGVCRHETSALTGQEAENSAALEAQNPGGALRGGICSGLPHAPDPLRMVLLTVVAML
jgi:hypothetical protein